MKKIFTLSTLLILSLALHAITTDKVAQVIKAGTKYYIYNTYYKKFLGSRTDKEGFAAISQWQTNDSTDYLWTAVQSTTADYFWLQQESTGKYLQASNASNDTWSVWITSNLNKDYDTFKWRIAAGDKATISNKKAANKFLGVDLNNETALYAGVYYDKDASDRTTWQFIEAAKGAPTPYINANGKEELIIDSIEQNTLILNTPIDYHILNSSPMTAQTKIQIDNEDAWLIFDHVRPSRVISTYLNQITINGEPAVAGTNCRVTIYLDGAAVIPHNANTYSALQTYTGDMMTGKATDYPIGVYPLSNYTANNNAISSIILRRGYMATLATSNDGTGYSRVFVADHKDLVISTLPTALRRRISYINVKRWNYVSKKGWSSTEGQGAINSEGALMNASWYYTWSADKNSQADMEYVPMNTHQYWPSVESIGNLNDCTHMLAINEPDHPEQHENCSCNENKHGITNPWTATTWTPRYAKTGMRIGSPCPTDAGWVKEYIKHIDDMAYRCDFVAFHAYWGVNEAANADAWYKQLEDIYKATGRPIWLTEFNNGASWTKETKPSYDENATKMRAILEKLNNAPFIERICIYNWDDYHLAVLSWDDKQKSWWTTPAGKIYRDLPPKFAYNADYQKVPNWWGFAIKQTADDLGIKSITWDEQQQTAKFSILNKNIDQTDTLMIEFQTAEGAWKPLREITERRLFDNTNYLITMQADNETMAPYYAQNKKELIVRLNIKDIKGKQAYSQPLSVSWASWLSTTPTAISSVTSPTTSTRIYSTDGNQHPAPVKGINILVKEGKTIKVIKK